MKAFTTIAALLGATYADPIQHIQYGTTGMRQINNHHSSNMKSHNNMQQQMSVQQTVSDMSHPKPVVSPNQYFLQDDFGNFAYGYSTQNSERAEEGNGNSVKGHFANIMADGKLRRVDYIADDQGFHILRDTADNTGRFIKREAEAEPSAESDFIKTRMTSIMDSTPLRDNTQYMSRMPNNMLGHDMSMNNMMHRNNQMSSNMYRSSGMMGHDMSSAMMGHDMSSNMMVNSMGKTMGQTMYPMGKDMSSTMMGRDMSSTMIGSNMGKMMGQNMYTNMMGHNMDKTMMGHSMDNPMLRHNIMDNTMMGRNMYTNMMGRDMSSNMMGGEMSSNMMGQKMYSNMMGLDMTSNMVSQDMPSHMMDNSMMDSQDMYTYSNVMGHDMNRMAPLNKMSQSMHIETMPSQSFSRFF